MKQESYETIAMLGSMLGAWVRGWADRMERRERMVNLIFGLVLGLGCSFLFVYLRSYLSIYSIFAILFSIGYISHDYTRKLKSLVDDIYGIFIGVVKQFGNLLIAKASAFLTLKSEKNDKKNN
jgi:predicted transporter